MPLMETINEKTQRSVIETSCLGKVVNIVAARAAHLHSLSAHIIYSPQLAHSASLLVFFSVMHSAR